MKVTDAQIVKAMGQANGSARKAAALLGVPTNTVRVRWKKIQVVREQREQERTAEAGEYWHRFLYDRDADARAWLVNYYHGLAARTAQKALSKLPGNVDSFPIVAAADDGLLEAIDRFDPGRGVKFTTYAIRLIGGRILDAMRSYDWASRKQRRAIRQRDQAEQALAQELGRRPTEDEVAGRLGWSLAEMREAAASGATQSLEEPQAELDSGRVLRLGDLLSTKEHTTQTMYSFSYLTRGLEIEEKLMVWLYFTKNRTMKEIAEVLELSESRVSQCMTAVKNRLAGCRNQAEEYEVLRDRVSC